MLGTVLIALSTSIVKTGWSVFALESGANRADVVVGVYYRPPTQDREVDEIFCRHLGEISRSLALVLVGDFNFPDICWKYNTAERDQSRRFLKCVGDNFLTQLVREPTRECVVLDLLFVVSTGKAAPR